ncbi:Spore germination protein [Geobacillus sp. BCO2]|nr:Spore germination protein [Geobacillus sp. BCO2]
MKQAIQERFLISRFLCFLSFMLHKLGRGTQFSASSDERGGAGCWMAVLMAGLAAHVLIWLMYRLLSHSPSGGDLVSLHEQYFGRWIGGVLSFGLLLYYALAALTVLQAYIEIIKVWVFPLIGRGSSALCFCC